jgi:predicted ATPase
LSARVHLPQTHGMPSFSLAARNFRGLRVAEWEIPEGLSVVVGPNGSGKTTLLRAFEFLSILIGDGVDRAIQFSGGRAGLRHFDAGDEPIEFSTRLGDLEWKVVLPFSGPSTDALFLEEIRWKGAPQMSFAAGSIQGAVLDAQDDRKPGESRVARYLAALSMRVESHAEQFSGVHSFLRRIVPSKYWSSLCYNLARLRRSGSPADSDTTLSADGTNVWSVLRNWRDKRETRARYDFVIAGMRDAFAAHFDELDFEFTAQQVSGRVYVPGRKDSVPFHLFSDGWMTGLLHLCAVASSNRGGHFILDEPENSLHPHAIRSIFRSMSAWAEKESLAGVFATHSPVVLNQFKDRSRVFVIEPGLARTPTALDEHPNAEWLSHFSVGDAYANEEVGAPRAAE